jgi:hypothetical protein
VARVNYGLDGSNSYKAFGKDIVISHLLPDYVSATPGQVLLFCGDLIEYCLNSSLSLTYKRYFNEDTDQQINKITLIADGKVLDANAFSLVKHV